MDLPALAARLANLTFEDPIWKLRRAALHTEIGEYVKATRLIRDATTDLERRHRLDRNSLSIKSQLGWASWVSRATVLSSTKWEDLPRPRDFTALDIDPLGEIEYIANRAREIEKKRRDEAAAVQPAFEPGHYRDGSSGIRFGAGDPGILLLYEFDQLIEQAGLPLRINDADICAGAAVAAVEAANQTNIEWHVWLLRALHSHMDRSFERLFSRVAIARMPAAMSSDFISIAKSAVSFWTSRFKDARNPEFRDDFSRAVDALRLSLVTLSRLTVWMPPDQAAAILRRAIGMANDPQLSHYWLIEAMGELAKYAVKAVPAAQQGSLALSILEFPLPSEKNGAKLPSWPELVTEIWDVRPVRDSGDAGWDHRVRQLLAAAQKGLGDREHATLRLAYLAMQNVLKPEETIALGKALWSDVDSHENALPQNTGLLPSTFLRLPAPDGIDIRARLRARLFDADLREVMKLQAPVGTVEIAAKIGHVSSLGNAAEFGLAPPTDVAVRMFDEIVVWQLQTTDRQDPFATSILTRFNDRMRLAVGHFLTSGVVRALTADERTEQRARSLMAFVTRTRSWGGLAMLPLFFSSAEGARAEMISIIRRGLIASESQHVGNAALAISAWAKLAREGTAPDPPRPLVEQLIATLETFREIGLSAMLDAARILFKNGFLREEDLHRLVHVPPIPLYWTGINPPVGSPLKIKAAQSHVRPAWAR
jgi:hypothetical protein